jgi:hypothetical protein
VSYTNPWGGHDYFDDVETREDGGTPAFMQTIKIALCVQLKEKMGTDKIHERKVFFDSFILTFDHSFDSLLRIKKRLGNQRTNEILALMQAAIRCQHTDNFRNHQLWLRAITVDYYDPMYLYQLDKRKERVVFRGNKKSVIQWLQENT